MCYFLQAPPPHQIPDLLCFPTASHLHLRLIQRAPCTTVDRAAVLHAHHIPIWVSIEPLNKKERHFTVHLYSDHIKHSKLV